MSGDYGSSVVTRSAIESHGSRAPFDSLATLGCSGQPIVVASSRTAAFFSRRRDLARIITAVFNEVRGIVVLHARFPFDSLATLGCSGQPTVVASRWPKRWTSG